MGDSCFWITPQTNHLPCVSLLLLRQYWLVALLSHISSVPLSSKEWLHTYRTKKFTDYLVHVFYDISALRLIESCLHTMDSEQEPRYHTATNAVAIPILSTLSILVSLVPAALHWKNRNFPATCLIGWFLVLNLFNIINAIVWPNDDVESWFSGAGLCDVEVKVMIASYVAVPGDLLGIFRGLASVLDTNRASLVPSKKQRWQNHFIDILFCVIVPIIAMITHIIYQANRYMLFAISGCVNSFDESWVSFVLSFMWPPIVCLIGGYYCGKLVPMVLLRFWSFPALKPLQRLSRVSPP